MGRILESEAGQTRGDRGDDEIRTPLDLATTLAGCNPAKASLAL